MSRPIPHRSAYGFSSFLGLAKPRGSHSGNLRFRPVPLWYQKFGMPSFLASKHMKEAPVKRPLCGLSSYSLLGIGQNHFARLLRDHIDGGNDEKPRDIGKD